MGKLLQALHPKWYDGVFGTGTKAGVIAFQQSKGILADGMVGKTWATVNLS